MRLKGILITVVLLLGLLFAALNWNALTTTLAVNLLLLRLELPLGLVLLLAALGLSLLFFALSLVDRAQHLSQANQLERQVTALQAKLDRKRLEELEALETGLRERLTGLEATVSDSAQRQQAELREQLEALKSQQQAQFGKLEERVLLVRNELAADIAEAEHALRQQVNGAAPESET